MALLDFINNRKASQQQPVAEKSQTQQPETAKQMYAREGAQEKANQKPMSEMPPDQKAKVEAIKEKLESSTQQLERNDKPLSHEAQDSNAGPEASRQNMNAQDKTAPAQSPTSGQAGRTEKDSQADSRQPEKSPQKDAGRSQQTVARPRPSWER